MNDKNHKEDELTLELLDAIEKDSAVSQRHLANHMGVALGLANSYLKRCVKKGFIKIKSAPANRYLYYITPQGFTEKSRLTAKYLSNSLRFYRRAGDSCKELFDGCVNRGWYSVVLCGMSDLAEIASIKAMESGVNIIGIFEPDVANNTLLGKAILRDVTEITADAMMVTSLKDPAGYYEKLSGIIEKDRILVPDILNLKI
jgi:DNA-binding MarR family transcriptional regulator